MPNGSATEHDVWTAINDIRKSVAEISVNTATLVRADKDRGEVCNIHAADIRELKTVAQENKLKIATGLRAQAFFAALIPSVLVVVPTLLILMKHMNTVAAEIVKASAVK